MLKSTTLQCDPNQTCLCFAWSCSFLFPAEPHTLTPLLQGVVQLLGDDDDDDKRSPTLEHSMTLFSVMGPSKPGCKCLQLPSHLRASSFFKKTRGLKSRLASNASLSRGHYKDNTGAQYYRGCPWREKRWLFPPPALHMSNLATAASYPGMSYAILRSNLWSDKQCPTATAGG